MSTQFHETSSSAPRPLPPDLDGFEIAPAKSSFIALFAFHHETSVLHVEYQSGTCSRYKADVELFRAWKAADNQSKFYHSHVRGKLELADPPVTAPIVAQEEPVEVSIGEPKQNDEPAGLGWEPNEPMTPEAASETAATASAELSAEEEQLQTTGKTLAEQAAAMKIADQKTYGEAAELFKTVLQMEIEITGHYAPMKDAAYKAHRAVCDAEKSMLRPITEAKELLRRSLGAYDAEQARLKDEADRKARLEAEQQSREQALNAAAEAEQQGAAPEEVEMILSTPAPVSIAMPTTTHEKFFASRQNWVPYLEGTERAALLKVIEAAHANPDAFADCLQLNMSEIKSRAKKQKAAFKVPGFYARPETKATSKALKGGSK